MNDNWIEFAIHIQSIAKAGLQYWKDKYDRERYEELRQIAAEMLSFKTDVPVNKIYDLFCVMNLATRHQKVDTRVAACALILMKIQILQHCLIKTTGIE